MKIVIVSDIHANYEALSALPESYDELWVLGDLVNYGPQPKEVVEWVRNNAAVVVRGNHDQAVGCDLSLRKTLERVITDRGLVEFRSTLGCVR